MSQFPFPLCPRAGNPIACPRHALAIGLIGVDFGRLDISPIEDCHQLMCRRTVFGPGAGRTRGRAAGEAGDGSARGLGTICRQSTLGVTRAACGEPAWPRLLTSSRRKGVGVRLATPALKKYPPICAVARRTNAGRLARTRRSAACEASDGIPRDAGASRPGLAGQCRRRHHAGLAYPSNAIG